MKLYLLEQDFNIWYDTHDSCVVVAENEEEARRIHPRWLDSKRYNKDGKLENFWLGQWELQDTSYDSWVWNNLDKVKVTYLWECILDTQKWVICASFNAG